jgi:hypothetical protein
MKLLFIADGQRDNVTVPKLVQHILGVTFEIAFQEWKRIRLARGSGYKRKLLFALFQARDAAYDGVVATIDSDNSAPGDRLRTLQSAREADRGNAELEPLPAAIGEAVPHLEAWLLDDQKAVRNVLKYSGDASIPNVRNCNPKSTLHELMLNSDRVEDAMTLLLEIAEVVEIERCLHSADTGFCDFVADVRAELGPLAESA